MHNELYGTDEQNADEPEEASFADLFEQSLKGLKEGEVIKGIVVDITQDFVVIDIGYKSEGTVRLSEFKDTNGTVEISEGDEVDVFIVRKEDKHGNPILSRERAKALKVWDELLDADKSGNTVRGVISTVIKGGYFVDLPGDLRAFLPGSQVDLRPVRDMESLVGKVFDFKILKADKIKNNIIVSRRALLEEEREDARKHAIATLSEGDLVKGVVKNITNYGAFIDVNGIDGLLHITDLSWRRVNHPSEVLNIGDDLDVQVLKFDKEKMRLTLGLKQITPDPWSLASEKYQIGTRATGKVVSLMDYGAFVELEDGFEGLVHISEMSWTKKIRHPSQLLKIADTVDVMVLNIETESRKVSLSLKQIEPNPWDIINERFPVGSTVSGKVKNIADFGVFIGFDEGIDGLVHISDMSWTKKIKHPSELYKEGDDIEAVVLAIDRENEKFSLGIKQFEGNPWDEARKKFKKGEIAAGKVTSITDFGIFIELAEGIEGLIRKTEFGSKGESAPRDIFKLGDEVTAEVISVNKKERRIALSIEAFEKSSEKATMQEYMAKQGEKKGTLGDILKNELKGEDDNKE